MKFSQLFVLVALAAINTVPCNAQDTTQSGQAEPNVTGTGNAGRIAVWKNSTTLGNSALAQSGGNVGIGTTAPAAKLEVNGGAQVDGNLEVTGNILSAPGSLGSTPVIQAPNDSMFNFSAG